MSSLLRHLRRTALPDELAPVGDAELLTRFVAGRDPDAFAARGHGVRRVPRQLGWPPGTVAGRLARGRALLALRLTRRGLPLSAGARATALAAEAAAAC